MLPLAALRLLLDVFVFCFLGDGVTMTAPGWNKLCESGAGDGIQPVVGFPTAEPCALFLSFPFTMAFSFTSLDGEGQVNNVLYVVQSIDEYVPGMNATSVRDGFGRKLILCVPCECFFHPTREKCTANLGRYEFHSEYFLSVQ